MLVNKVPMQKGEKHCLVRFVDYGNIAIVNQSTLRSIEKIDLEANKGSLKGKS